MPVAVKEPEIAPLSAPVSASAAAAAQADEQPSNGAAGGVIRKGVASPASSGSKPPSGGAGGSSSSIKQHKQGVKSKRAATTVYLVLGVCAVIVALALAGRRAAQDERVIAAVNESVQRINTTLNEHMDGFLEHLSKVSDRVNSILEGDDAPRPGQLAAAAGLKAHHPIVIIPGFVTSGLELWQGEPCAQSYFRQRLWGTLSMAQTLLSDRMCWMRHMKLDPVTGGDPPGIKLRAAKALEAVDYFVPGYWVFSKLIQSLSDIGYDNNNLIAVPYDWRLPIPVMEKRDGFFTRVKREIELQYQLSEGIKPVLLSHSYGAIVTVTFLNWVEQQSPGWVDTHLEGYVNLAGPLLGLPKALSPMLSGETRETVDMMAGLAVLVEQYLGKQSRAALFRTWGSVMAMLPVGGSKVWGNATSAPDDDDVIRAAGRSYGGIVAEVRSADANLKEAVGRNDSSLLSSESLQLLHTTLHNWGNTIRTLGGVDTAANDTDDDDDNSSESDKSESGGKKSDKSEEQKETADELKVRFLDVASAILAMARTAGEQVTANLQHWSPAGRELQQQLDKVLEAHRQAAEALALKELQLQQQQQEAAAAADESAECCKTGLGDYKGSCATTTTSGGGGGSSGSGGSGGDVCSKEGEGGGEQKQQEGGGGDGDGSNSCSSSSSSMIGSSTEQSREGAAILDSHKQQEGGAAARGDSSSSSSSAVDDGSSSSDNGSSSSTFLRALKQRVLGGSGGSTASSAGGGGDAGGGSAEGQQDKASSPGAGAGTADSSSRGVQPANVLQVPLPNAKHFKVYCFYGIGTPTERGYHYLKTRKRVSGGALHTEWSINNVADDPKSRLESGVQLSPDGDGTVPLLSLGALCAGGWRTKRLNPAGLPVVIREYPNNPCPVLRDARGGPNASTHVELLGNEPMLNDLLHIAAGRHSDIQDSILTPINDIAAKIPWDEL